MICPNCKSKTHGDYCRNCKTIVTTTLCPNCEHGDLFENECPICGFTVPLGACNTLWSVYHAGYSGLKKIEVFTAFGSIQDGTLSPFDHDEIGLEIMQTWGVCLMSAEPVEVRS